MPARSPASAFSGSLPVLADTQPDGLKSSRVDHDDAPVSPRRRCRVLWSVRSANRGSHRAGPGRRGRPSSRVRSRSRSAPPRNGNAMRWRAADRRRPHNERRLPFALSGPMHWPQQFLNFTTSEGTVSTESAGPLCVSNLAIQPGHTTRAENASADDLQSLALSRFAIVQLGHRGVGPPTRHAADRRTAAAAPRPRRAAGACWVSRRFSRGFGQANWRAQLHRGR